jgi:acetyl esterase
MALDPDVARLLEAARLSAARPFDSMTGAEAREAYNRGRAASMPEPQPVAEIRGLQADGPHGAIPLLLYRPQGAAAGPLPALIYFHGGGWVMGSPATHDTLCRHLANRAGCIVLSVDYRLAPEHAFPAAVDDAWSATRWIAARCGELGLDPARLAVGGDSAGGNLATVVCLLARDAGGPPLAFQLLLYPVTDLAMDTPSQAAFAEGYSLTRTMQGWYQGLYLGPAGDPGDWRVSPLRAASLERLPPACVVTAEYDPLRDEAEAYARRLAAEAKVPVTLWRVPGQIHGFLPMGKVIAAAGPALDRIGDALKAALALTL